MVGATDAATSVGRRCRRIGATALAVLAAAVTFGLVAFGSGEVLLGVRSAAAQDSQFLNFKLQLRPKPTGKSVAVAPKNGTPQMLVQADEIRYDYANQVVSADGNVQIYYNGATIEADKVVYDQRTKRLHAEGNARLTEADGKISYGEIIDLSDDYRDGFIDSLRLETVDETRMAATRADRTGVELHGIRERRVHGLRSLPGRSEEAAAMAGQGGAHHPQPS